MKRIIAIIAVLGLVAILGGCVHKVKDAQGHDSTTENEASKRQLIGFQGLLQSVNSGKVPLGDEMRVGPADPTKPMQNVSVVMKRAVDPQIMLALIQLCDMSHYKSPAGVADVLIAMMGSLERVAINGLDKLPWKWGFDALSGALNQKGYSVTTGNNGNVIIASNKTNAPQVGRDLNSGNMSGSDRDKEKSKVTNKTEAGSD